MKNIPTAEEFLQDHLEISHFYDDKTNQMVCFSSDVQKAMIEFAKLHVESALKEVSKLRVYEQISYRNLDSSEVKFIKNSYPLTNIK